MREMTLFAQHGTGGPSAALLRVDVRGPNQRSPWNIECARIFAENYIKLPTALTDDVEEVEDVFLSHIRALCRQYKQVNNAATGAASDTEPAVEMIRRSRRRKVREPSYPLISCLRAIAGTSAI